jgi:hypothetical protein
MAYASVVGLRWAGFDKGWGVLADFPIYTLKTERPLISLAFQRIPTKSFFTM